jgi:hypothetical protein
MPGENGNGRKVFTRQRAKKRVENPTENNA